MRRKLRTWLDDQLDAVAVWAQGPINDADYEAEWAVAEAENITRDAAAGDRNG